MSEPYTPSNKPGETVLDQASTKLILGSLYNGIITSVDPTAGTCVVLTDSPGASIEGAFYVAGGLMAPLLGFKTRTVPPLGARVTVLYGKPPMIVAQAPVEPTDTAMGNKKSSSGLNFRADKEVYGDGIVKGPVADSDLLEGEYDVSNAMNVGLLFLNNLMCMRAGDRAKVETCLLNDMVRIVSEVYRHHSAFGDFEIYNDGHLNVEWHGTSYEHESYNKSDPKSPKVPTKNKEVAIDQVEDQALFKQRFSMYLGHLGDFIQMFIREPQDTSESIITGKARLFVGTGGSINFQTTDEIVFEKVVRVTVPRRKEAYDSPDGDKYADELPTEPLIEWDFGAGNKNIHHTAYQLREYARYLSLHKNLARFRQKEKDFEIPKETEIPAPSASNRERDREGVNGSKEFFEAYSTIRMLRGGGIILVAGDGSCVNLNNRQVTISALERITMDTPGDIEMTAGGSIYKTAYKDIHSTAVTGGILQKARKRFHLLVEQGLLWLKSDGTEKTTETGRYGIYLDAAEGDMAINSKGDLCMRSQEKDVILRADKSSVIVKARENILLIPRTGALFLQSVAKGIIMQCRKFHLQARKILLNDNIQISPNNFKVSGNMSVSGRLKAGALWNGEDVKKLRGKYLHGGHVRVMSAAPAPPEPDTELTSMVGGLLSEAAASSPIMEQLDDSVWRYDVQDFPDRTANGTYTSSYRSWTQDYAFTHPDIAEEYEDWKLEDNKLKSATRTSESMPYPGDRFTQEMVHPNDAGDILDKPADYTFQQTALKPETIVRKRRK